MSFFILLLNSIQVVKVKPFNSAFANIWQLNKFFVVHFVQVQNTQIFHYLSKHHVGKISSVLFSSVETKLNANPLSDFFYRYFVIKVVEGEKTAYLGLGFADRADSFDLNTHLHDHFKGILVSVHLEFLSSQLCLIGLISKTNND